MNTKQNNFFNKFIFSLFILVLVIAVSGCTGEKSYPIRSNQIENANTGNTNNNQDISLNENSDSQENTVSQSEKTTNTNLPDIILKDFKIYDQTLKRYIELSEPITGSDPVEMTIVIKNQGNVPYIGPKGNAPIIITMITEAYPSNLYFYSNNYTALNPGEERTYKSNVIKFRTLGTFETRIFPSIQYTTDQPEELSIENNEMSLELTVKAK